MKPRSNSVSRKTRVPVSTAGKPSPGQASQPRPVGLNSLHERLLIDQLVNWYGWHAAEDGNLYSPMPSDFSWGDNAA